MALAGTVQRHPLLAAALAGGCFAATLPPRSWWPLAVLGVALLALALRDARWARRLAVGGVAAVVWFGVGLAWMAGFTSPGYVLAVVLEAAIVAAAMIAVPPGATRFAALPAALTLAEAVRLRWPFGGFPLAAIVHGQVDGPLLAVAALGGGLSVTALVAVSGVAAAALVERRAMSAAIASAVVGFALLGAFITTTPQPVARLRVAAVQGGGERGIPGVVADSAAVFDRHLDAAADVESPIDLVLLPEDVLDLDGPVADSDAARATGDVARRLDATMVVGVVEDVGDDRFRNAAVAWAPSGLIVGRVEKVQRVPFGEYIPARALVSRVADVSLVPRDAIPGEGPGLLVTPAGQLGVTISYEVFFSERARSAVRAGADILLVPTNAASFTGAAVPAEEIAAARVRAVETGRAVVQAASTGYSALIGPDGELRQRSQLEEPAVLRADVARRSGLTPFVRTGSVPILGAAALVLLGSGVPALLARPLLRQAPSPVIRPVHRRFRGARTREIDQARAPRARPH